MTQPYLPGACGGCGHDLGYHKALTAHVIDNTCKWRGCGCPWFTQGPRPDETIALYLSKYERDNLLAALYAASGWGSQRSPLYVLNTGDWLGQVLFKLGAGPNVQTDFGQPNVNHSNLTANANLFDKARREDGEPRG